MIPARQSTALELSIGPVLDADGVAVTGGVVGDFKIKKTTGNFAALNGSATLTHVSAGTYDLVLTTSDTDTVGLCSIAIDDTTNACAPVYLQVMEEAIYDALYAASANAFAGAAGSTTLGAGAVTATVVATGAIDADALATDAVEEIRNAITGGAYDLDTDANGRIRIVDGTAAGELDTASGLAKADLINIAGAAVSTMSAQIGVNVAAITNDVIDAGKIAAGVWEEMIEAMFSYNATLAYSTATAGSLVKEIADNAGGSALSEAGIAAAVWNKLQADHVTAGSFGEIATEIAAILVDTGTTLDARIPAALVSGRMDVSVGAMAANVITAASAASDFGAEIQALITGGAYALSTDASGYIRVVDGTGTGEINTSSGSVSVFDFTTAAKALLQTEAEDALVVHRLDELLNADSDIDGAAPPTVGSVFHELLSKTAGSFTYDQTTDSLEALRDRGDAAWLTATGFSTHSAADAADAVWDEANSGHLTAGTTGKNLLDLVTVVAALNDISAADVWSVGGRTLTALDEDSTIIDLDATIRAALGLATANLDSQLAAIVADTNELQTDWANGGRLDLLLDAILDDTGTSGVVVNAAGLATDAVQEIRNAITGGAYALSTDASGMIRIVDGTGTGEIDTTSGAVVVTAASVRAAVGLASANLDTQLDALPTAAENAAANWDLANGIETSVTPRQALRALSAVLAGLIADAGGATETYKGIGQASGGTTRVTATVDASGNRSAITLNL